MLIMRKAESKRSALLASILAMAGILLICALPLYAQDEEHQTHSDPELRALQEQNAILQERIKLVTQQQQLDKLNNPNPLARESELLEQRIKSLTQEGATLRPPPAGRNEGTVLDKTTDSNGETYLESSRLAYKALDGIAADIAGKLSCGGKNVVLYGSAQWEALLTYKAFQDQLDLLSQRLKLVLDIPAPVEPKQSAHANDVYSTAALASPVMHSVLDLITLIHASRQLVSQDLPLDENGVIATIANAAVVEGCIVYWPDQYVANPVNPGSRLMATLQSLSDLNDDAGVSEKPAGLQQKLQRLETELKRVGAIEQALLEKIDTEQNKLAAASTGIDLLRDQIDWLTRHIENDKDSSLQAKINQTFAKSWTDLETAVKKQLGANAPGTMEDQNRLDEMGKKLELLKAQTIWLSQYVRDEKETAIQDRMKRSLGTYIEELEAEVKDRQALLVSVPKTIEPDQKELERWTKYESDLKELIATGKASSDAYIAFRGVLLDGSTGVSPLSRMLSAEALRDLLFDEKLQARSGSSVVQIKVERLGGTSRTKVKPDAREGFSGGVILSFVQYEPNGRIKNSGVQTAYLGFQ